MTGPGANLRPAQIRVLKCPERYDGKLHPSCGGQLIALPHSELVTEHWGCERCGRVFYHDGDEWRECKFPEQDVPSWRPKVAR